MFIILPNSAGIEPWMSLTERSIHVRLLSSPTSVQFVIGPEMLLSRSVSAVIRPNAHDGPSR